MTVLGAVPRKGICMNFVSPAACGISESDLQVFMGVLKRERVNLHSVLLAKGNDIFFEKYWAPFTSGKPHRMYSETKSFVSVAIGCLIDEGKLSLESHIVEFFKDKLPEYVPEELKEQTIEDMLTMRTCFMGSNWFKPDVTDRLKFYFAQPVEKLPGTIFSYDSNGSYVMGCLVERLSGMSLIDYLKQKVLNTIGGFENAEILKVCDGTPWGDSALVCESRALMNFARFVLNMGAWQGRQLVSRDYMKAATSFQTDNNPEDVVTYCGYGYGRQFWLGSDGSFYLYGMGGQFGVCVPDKDLIMVTTADTQLNPAFGKSAIHRAFFDYIVKRPQPMADLDEELTLSTASGRASNPFAQKINGARFVCKPNKMGITELGFAFNGDTGEFNYVNAQGNKVLKFGMGKNEFGKFPQLGYSNDFGNARTSDGFMYDCAVSAAWVSQREIRLKVQVIDRYLGQLVINADFKNENELSIQMVKRAEDFFDEYEGVLYAKRKIDT